LPPVEDIAERSRRQRGVVAGVARRGAFAGSSDSDCFGVALLSAGAACGSARRYLRPSAADLSHRSVDVVHCDGTRSTDSAALDYTVAATAPDASSCHWRRAGSPDVARGPA